MIICLLIAIIMCLFGLSWFFFFFKQKTAYEMRISDWSSDVCSSDLMTLMPHRHSSVCGVVNLRGQTLPVVDLSRAIGLRPLVPDERSTIIVRSEERRVGKECVSTCRSRWSPYH